MDRSCHLIAAGLNRGLNEVFSTHLLQSLVVLVIQNQMCGVRLPQETICSVNECGEPEIDSNIQFRASSKISALGNFPVEKLSPSRSVAASGKLATDKADSDNYYVS